MMKFCSLLILLSLVAINSSQIAMADETSDKLEKMVSKLPRTSLGIPLYWFEMSTVVGWEKMMLVFGYADNRKICSHLKSIARDDSPNREFRCKSAN